MTKRFIFGIAILAGPDPEYGHGPRDLLSMRAAHRLITLWLTRLIQALALPPAPRLNADLTKYVPVSGAVCYRHCKCSELYPNAPNPVSGVVCVPAFLTSFNAPAGSLIRGSGRPSTNLQRINEFHVQVAAFLFASAFLAASFPYSLTHFLRPCSRQIASSGGPEGASTDRLGATCEICRPSHSRRRKRPQPCPTPRLMVQCSQASSAR
jgi:hypothetical protein